MPKVLHIVRERLLESASNLYTIGSEDATGLSLAEAHTIMLSLRTVLNVIDKKISYVESLQKGLDNRV